MKKGQSWAEYITVLAVTIIMAGIAMYMAGAFMGNNSQISERDSASYWFSADVGITRYYVNSSAAQLLIKNNKNFKINVTNISSTGAGILIAPGGANNVVLDPGQSVQVTAPGLTCLSGTYSIPLVITYADVNYGTKYTVYGEKPLIGQCMSSIAPPQCSPLCNSPNDPACNDGVACTADACTNPGTCNAVCTHTPITACINNDGCCPTGCSLLNDNDCPPACGNGICETGETYSNCPGDCCLSACTATYDNKCHSNCINFPISAPCSNFKPACDTITRGTSVCYNSTHNVSCCDGTPTSCATNSTPCNAYCNANQNCTFPSNPVTCQRTCNPTSGLCQDCTPSCGTATCTGCGINSIPCNSYCSVRRRCVYPSNPATCTKTCSGGSCQLCTPSCGTATCTNCAAGCIGAGVCVPFCTGAGDTCNVNCACPTSGKTKCCTSDGKCYTPSTPCPSPL